MYAVGLLMRTYVVFLHFAMSANNLSKPRARAYIICFFIHCRARARAHIHARMHITYGTTEQPPPRRIELLTDSDFWRPRNIVTYKYVNLGPEAIHCHPSCAAACTRSAVNYSTIAAPFSVRVRRGPFDGFSYIFYIFFPDPYPPRDTCTLWKMDRRPPESETDAGQTTEINNGRPALAYNWAGRWCTHAVRPRRRPIRIGMAGWTLISLLISNSSEHVFLLIICLHY